MCVMSWYVYLLKCFKYRLSEKLVEKLPIKKTKNFLQQKHIIKYKEKKKIKEAKHFVYVVDQLEIGIIETGMLKNGIPR